jgi:hypothetical protein
MQGVVGQGREEGAVDGMRLGFEFKRIDHLRSYVFRTEGCRDGSLYEIERSKEKLQYVAASPISERWIIWSGQVRCAQGLEPD